MQKTYYCGMHIPTPAVHRFLNIVLSFWTLFKLNAVIVALHQYDIFRIFQKQDFRSE